MTSRITIELTANDLADRFSGDGALLAQALNCLAADHTTPEMVVRQLGKAFDGAIDETGACVLRALVARLPQEIAR